MRFWLIKTYFNGAITENQLLTLVLAVIAMLIVVMIAKKIVKLLLVSGVLFLSIFIFNMNAPLQLNDISKVFDQHRSEVNQLSRASDSIKIVSSSDKNDIQIKVGDKWVSIKDINSYVKNDNGIYTITTDNTTYSIKDDSIKRLLDLFKK